MLTLRDAMADMLDRMTLADPVKLEPPFDSARSGEPETVVSTEMNGLAQESSALSQPS
jgi:hypothetical protein